MGRHKSACSSPTELRAKARIDALYITTIFHNYILIDNIAWTPVPYSTMLPDNINYRATFLSFTHITDSDDRLVYFNQISKAPEEETDAAIKPLCGLYA